MQFLKDIFSVSMLHKLASEVEMATSGVDDGGVASLLACDFCERLPLPFCPFGV